METNLTDALTMICDKDNPQDKKLLLLAELVETKCNSLARNQSVLLDKLSETNGNLSETRNQIENLTRLLEENKKETMACPVHQHRNEFSKLAVTFRYPKLFVLAIIGMIALLTGVVGTKIFDLIVKIFGL